MHISGRKFKTLTLTFLLGALFACLYTASAATGTVTGSVVNLRAGASTSKAVVAKVERGTQLTIVDKEDNGWYRVTYNGQDAYIIGTYFKKDYPVPGVVTGRVVNLRAAAGTGSGVLEVLSRDTKIQLTGDAVNGWYPVLYGEIKGYMSADYVRETEEAAVTPAPAPTATPAPTAVPTPAPETTPVPEADPGPVDEETTPNSSSTAVAYKPGVITGSVVNFRSGPSTSTTILAALPRGTEVKLYALADGWYKAEYAGLSGYLSASYVAEKSVSDAGVTSNATAYNVVAFAKQFLGYAYKYGGQHPSTGFDCGGFVRYVYGKYGYDITMGATSQYNSLPVKVSYSSLSVGDLVFFTSPSSSGIAHVGIYIGGGQFIHASSPGDVVKINTLTTGYYANNYYGAARVIV